MKCHSPSFSPLLSHLLKTMLGLKFWRTGQFFTAGNSLRSFFYIFRGVLLGMQQIQYFCFLFLLFSWLRNFRFKRQEFCCWELCILQGADYIKGDVSPVGKVLALEEGKTKSDRTEEFANNIRIGRNSLFALSATAFNVYAFATIFRRCVPLSRMLCILYETEPSRFWMCVSKG